VESKTVKLTVVYNAKSGSALNAKAIRDLCERLGVTVEKLVPVGPHIKKDLSPAVNAGATIAAIGGDGTLSAVAGIIAGTRAVLLPLPGGTLNNFTKTLGIQQDIDKALAKALKSKPSKVDVASVNGTYFINNSSIGLYPRSLRYREKVEGTVGKWPAAVVSTFRALFQFHKYHVSIGDDDFKTPFIFIGNNDYHFDDSVDGLRDRLDAGVLSVYIVKSSRRSALLKILFASLFHKLDSVDSFDYRKTKKLVINTKKTRAVSVSHDGEVSKIRSPLTYEVHAKHLNILY
jgi:diacylglycerol kinase family enzyme